MKHKLVRMLAKMMRLKLDISTNKDMWHLTIYMLNTPLEVLSFDDAKKK